MTTIRAMRELARASKQISNNPNLRVQVAERKDGKGFNTYRVYGNEYFNDDPDEMTIGYISEPLTYKQVEYWLRMRKKADGSFIGYR